jgi:hypothetical protein
MNNFAPPGSHQHGLPTPIDNVNFNAMPARTRAERVSEHLWMGDSNQSVF